MREEDLWIGDHVRLLKSQRNGIYEGRSRNGKATVRIKEKKILTNYSNLERLPDPGPTPMPVEKKQLTDSQIIMSDRDILDLHIEHLAPDLKHQLPQIILRKQITAAKSFVESAIRSRWQNVTIIHGLGTGELKKEVHFLLNQYEAVSEKILVNNGGATLVTFRYV